MNDEFWEEYTEVQGEDALITKGGLKISFSFKELSDYFGVLLDKRPLQSLIGETAYWVLIPSLVAIYSFPIILYLTQNLSYSLLASWGLLISMSFFNQSSYNFKINRYLVKPASHILPKIFINIIFSILLFQLGYNIVFSIFPFIWWILVERIPLIYLVTEMLLIMPKTWAYTLADPDGVLRQVGFYWAKNYNLKQSETGRVLGNRNR